MKNRFIRSTLRLAPLATALSFAAIVPLHAQTAVPKAPIYGVTLDTIAHLNKTITSLQKLPYRPTVRVVFDPGTTAADYYPALVKLHQVAYVMGEILDSSEFPPTWPATRRARRTSSPASTASSTSGRSRMKSTANGCARTPAAATPR